MSRTKDTALPGLKAEALYWSERGEISCGCHTPYPGSDTWNWDAWAEITAAEAAAFEKELGNAPACETCAAIQRNHD